MRPITDGDWAKYRFRYTDLDFNQHVNTVRYVELLMNQCHIDYWTKKRLNRFEISFSKECTYNQEVNLLLTDNNGDIRIDINDAVSGANHCKARFVFV